ncbi:MAG: AEC family transporter [bacterium]
MNQVFLLIYKNFLVVLPIFCIIGLGYVLKKKKFMDAVFMDKASKLVFWICLPVLLFQKIAQSDFGSNFNLQIILVCYSCLGLIFFISLFLGKLLGISGKSLGVFIQGCFRSNAAIVGLSVIINVFPDNSDEMIARAGIFIAFLVPPFNTLSVFALLLPGKDMKKKGELKKIILSVLYNPLIIGCFFGILFSVFKIGLPAWLNKAGGFLANMTLPLALLAVGGSFSFTRILGNMRLLIPVNIMKLIIFPAIIVLILRTLNVNADNLVIVTIIIASPTAIASYIMACAMKSDSELAGSIVMSSTVVSMFTFTFWLTIMRWIQ